MSIERAFQCPFCGRFDSAGALGVDSDALLRAVPTAGAAEQVSEEVEWSPDEQRRIFLFNPDGVPGRPCPHTVSFILDVWLNLYEDERPRSL